MIDHISNSALRTYCTDRRDFFKRYILKEKTYENTATMAIGSCIHKYLELRGERLTTEASKIGARDTLKEQMKEMTYTKTQTPESVAKQIEKIMDYPELEDLLKNEFIMTEESITAKLNWLDIPIKGAIDSVIEENGEYTIIDYKVVDAFSEGVKPSYEIQAIIYLWLLHAHKDIIATKIKFIEIKKSENRDGSPRLRVIEIEPTPERLRRVALFVKAICHEILHNEFYQANNQPVYTPNPYNREYNPDDWQEFGASFIF